MVLLNLVDLIQVPFGYLMSWLYQLTTNYGVALIIFAVIVKVVLYPATAKSKKSTMKMSRMTPRLEAIKKKYDGDQQKIAEATRALYKEEGVSMGGGCLWSLLPLLLLIPLYTVVRQPITYILQEFGPDAGNIAAAVKGAAAELAAADPTFISPFTANTYYDQMVAAPLIPMFADAVKTAVPTVGDLALKGMNFDFIGVNLAAVPQDLMKAWQWNWAHIGAVVIPVISAGSQVFSMLISRKLNDSLVTDEKGLQDKETAKKSQSNKSGKVMMYVMPAFSLWIGITIPVALSLYWAAQGIISTVMDVHLTKKYRKIYDAEDAERLRIAMEKEALEAEKERIRAERRAANPDGITQNTSKKKLQQQQQREQEAAKAAAKKEYDARKGIVNEDNAGDAPASGDNRRRYSRGRAYDPNRYASQNTEDK